MMLLFSPPSCNHDAGTHVSAGVVRCAVPHLRQAMLRDVYDIEDIDGNGSGVYFA